MNVSEVKNFGLPFRAETSIPASLVSGNWGYLTAPVAKKDEFKSVNNHAKNDIWKTIVVSVIAVAAIAACLGTARCKWNGMDELMPKKFGDVEGFGQKCKWVIGKAGDAVVDAYNATLGKLFGKIGKNLEPPVPKPQDTPKPIPVPPKSEEFLNAEKAFNDANKRYNSLKGELENTLAEYNKPVEQTSTPNKGIKDSLHKKLLGSEEEKGLYQLVKEAEIEKINAEIKFTDVKIAELNREISNLQAELGKTTDSSKISQLNAEINAKNEEITRLQAESANAKENLNKLSKKSGKNDSIIRDSNSSALRAREFTDAGGNTWRLSDDGSYYVKVETPLSDDPLASIEIVSQ